MFLLVVLVQNYAFYSLPLPTLYTAKFDAICGAFQKSLCEQMYTERTTGSEPGYSKSYFDMYLVMWSWH